MKPFTVKRPWGQFRQFTKGTAATVKTITVRPGQELSLQYHKHRTEFWHVISGRPRLTIGAKTKNAKPGDEVVVKPRALHRISAGKTPVVILEIAFGAFNEKDIVRVKDRYGRVKK